MKHKTLSILLAVLMSMTAGVASAHDFEVDGIYYGITSGSTVAVTFRGSSFVSYGNEYRGNVTIPESVTYNGKTYSVTTIGENAFYECSGLTSVTIPNSVTSIGNFAFRDCTGLASVAIPNSVTSIGEYAFYECSGLSSVTISDNVSSIGEHAFENTQWYNNQPEGLMYAGKVAYKYIGTMPENTAIVLEEGTLGVAGDAFSSCSSLTSIVIPNGVISIGDFAFSGCSLNSVTIPSSLTSIGHEVFSFCDYLEQIVVESGNTVFDSRDNCNAIIETASNKLIVGCRASQIPETVTAIGSSAFAGRNNIYEIVDSYTFSQNYSNYYSDPWDTPWWVGHVIVIPNSVTSIGESAFYACRDLYKVVIPNGVITIANSAFADCWSLFSVSIPESVTSIENGAFAYSSVYELYCYSTNPLSIDENVFAGRYDVYDNYENMTLHVPDAGFDTYRTTEPWSHIRSFCFLNKKLIDGEVYDYDTDIKCDTLTYTRTFNNTQWQALYIPFEIDDVNWFAWCFDADIARINNMNQYDDNDDGIVDRTVMEVIKVTSGTIEAHTPYLIRAKSTGEKSITLIDLSSITYTSAPMDITLYAAEERSHDVSSWTTLYTFTGTYSGISGSEMYSNRYYALGDGTLHQAASGENDLKPMRWYMAVTDRDGYPKQLGEVKIVVFGDEEETDNLTPTLSPLDIPKGGASLVEEGEGESPLYDLSGRRVTNPRHGIYVKNGRKVVIK